MSDITPVRSEGGNAELAAIERLLPGPVEVYDDQIDKNTVPLQVVDMEAEQEVDIKLRSDLDPFSAQHLATHLPKCAGCAGCMMGKTVKSRSQRRPVPGVTVQSQDAVDKPFGAMVHMDHLEMERGTEVCALLPQHLGREDIILRPFSMREKGCKHRPRQHT